MVVVAMADTEEVMVATVVMEEMVTVVEMVEMVGMQVLGDKQVKVAKVDPMADKMARMVLVINSLIKKRKPIQLPLLTFPSTVNFNYCFGANFIKNSRN